MDLIYANAGRQDLGVLSGFVFDLDINKGRDFALESPLSGSLLAKGFYIYIPGTEYGGVIDARKIDSKANKITYSGRNWRGFLASYIIDPPNGSDYRTVTGTLSDITATLLETAGITALFTADTTAATVTGYSFDRYVDLYTGLTDLAAAAGKTLKIEYTSGTVHLSYVNINDYSATLEYSQDAGIYFVLSDTSAAANHLICLGTGQLAAREVLHLYIQADGTIGTTKYYVGLQEVTAKLDEPNAESSADLEAKGRKKLAELASSKTFSMSAENITLGLGDIVGARDRVTGAVMSAAVTNIIVKIKDGVARLNYTIGG